MKYIKPGTRVRLSNAGLEAVGRNLTWEIIDMARDMKVTSCENINAGTLHESIWAIEVDQPAINEFMLDSGMVEILK